MQAAGGVPMRRGDDGAVEVLLVHRPRYRDWTFPNCSGSFDPNDEVDRVEWLTLDEAAGRLSHRRDLDVLQSLELVR